MPKISALPPYTSPEPDDELPIVDSTAETTKKITLNTVKNWLQSLVGWITTDMLGNSSVTANKQDVSTGARTVVKETTAGSWSNSTSYSNASNALSLEAGVWKIEGIINSTHSRTSLARVDVQIWNETDSEQIGQEGWTTALNSTGDNQHNIPVLATVVLNDTKSVRLRARITSTSGSNGISRRVLTATKVASLE